MMEFMMILTAVISVLTGVWAIYTVAATKY
ncbi:hypothetical protein B0H94_108112 [Salsuginibacillus halophilus]|uniref:Uncharacterized protein n=1 Tax=Salsuginibacillus halophilus TaxID=517424 RepID=A0A2P8HE54_9BACI|nr:hypothetical protein B0H94_108112 [Salsuginibacillus halophilus]